MWRSSHGCTLRVAARGHTRWAPGHDAKARSPPPSLAQPQVRLRHQNQVATSSRPIQVIYTNQVMTSKPGRDRKQLRLGRDLKLMSRPHFCPPWDFQVATREARSRPPHTATHVVTSKVCRDTDFLYPAASRLRHQLVRASARSRHQNQVATWDP